MLSNDGTQLSGSLNDLLYFGGKQAVTLVDIVAALADQTVLIGVPDVAGIDLDQTIDTGVAVERKPIITSCAYSIRPNVHTISSHIHTIGSCLHEPCRTG